MNEQAKGETQETPPTAHPLLSDELDAERYRRLAWLVRFGDWSVVIHVNKYGLKNDRFMEDKIDLDAWLDNPEVIDDAESCARALLAANCDVRRG